MSSWAESPAGRSGFLRAAARSYLEEDRTQRLALGVEAERTASPARQCMVDHEVEGVEPGQLDSGGPPRSPAVAGTRRRPTRSAGARARRRPRHRGPRRRYWNDPPCRRCGCAPGPPGVSTATARPLSLFTHPVIKNVWRIGITPDAIRPIPRPCGPRGGPAIRPARGAPGPASSRRRVGARVVRRHSRRYRAAPPSPAAPARDRTARRPHARVADRHPQHDLERRRGRADHAAGDIPGTEALDQRVGQPVSRHAAPARG